MRHAFPRVGVVHRQRQETTTSFLSLLADQMQAGRQAESGSFKPTSWQTVATELSKELGRKVEPAQLISKWKRMKKEYQLWNDMVKSSSGWHSDPASGIDAPSDEAFPSGKG